MSIVPCLKSSLTLMFLITSLSVFSQPGGQLRLGQMVKQTMKESWADIEPLGEDEEGVYYLAIPYTEVIAVQ